MKRKQAAYALVQTLIFVAVLALVALPSQPSGPIVSSTVTLASTPSLGSGLTSATQENDTTGLLLALSLSSSSIESGKTVSITIEEQNTLPQANMVPASTNATSPTIPRGLSTGPCPVDSLPFGFAVFQGYSTVSNYSSAQVLNLYKPGIYNCPLEVNAHQYDFEASSETAVIDGSLIENMSLTASFGGYWTGGVANASFTNFPAGVYTVVAGDEWGALLVAHFVVEQSSG